VEHSFRGQRHEPPEYLRAWAEEGIWKLLDLVKRLDLPTRDGLLFAHLYTKIYDHVLGPLATTDRPNAPPEFLAAIDTIARIVVDHITQAQLPTVS
jgi:hypothetical protein